MGHCAITVRLKMSVLLTDSEADVMFPMLNVPVKRENPNARLNIFRVKFFIINSSS